MQKLLKDRKITLALTDKAKAWLANGAQPSDTVARLFKQAGILPAGK